MPGIVVIEKSELQEMLQEVIRQELNKLKTKTIDYLTVEQTAELLGVHVSTISRAAKAGELKYYSIGRMKFFDKNDLFTEAGQNSKLFRKKRLKDY